jgi:hypothetical protein
LPVFLGVVSKTLGFAGYRIHLATCRPNLVYDPVIHIAP